MPGGSSAHTLRFLPACIVTIGRLLACGMHRTDCSALTGALRRNITDGVTASARPPMQRYKSSVFGLLTTWDIVSEGLGQTSMAPKARRGPCLTPRIHPSESRPGAAAEKAQRCLYILKRTLLNKTGFLKAVVHTPAAFAPGRGAGESALLCSSPFQSLQRRRKAAALRTAPSRSSQAARRRSRCGLPPYALAVIICSAPPGSSRARSGIRQHGDH